MIQREFCCTACSLYFWEGITKFRYSYECPDCGSQEGVYAVDTFGWAMTYESIKASTAGKTWSSLKYAPEFAVDHYKKQGITIKQ